jgi:hypothetical protein
MTDVFWLNKADFQPVAKVFTAGELVEALRKAPKQVIAHHLTKSKNDFANWARGSLKDADLAAKLSAIRYDDPDALNKVIAAFAASRQPIALPKPEQNLQIPKKH